jgi:hypothetical protein
MLKCTLSSWGCVSAIDSNRRTIWIADAHRGDGKRFIFAVLFKELVEQHRVELKSGMTVLAATVKEQAAQIQKVSAQLEGSKPAPQVVSNNP